MNALPTVIRTVRWMVRDTFRQSLLMTVRSFGA